jgi:hypothetical protein
MLDAGMLDQPRSRKLNSAFGDDIVFLPTG